MPAPFAQVTAAFASLRHEVVSLLSRLRAATDAAGGGDSATAKVAAHVRRAVASADDIVGVVDACIHATMPLVGAGMRLLPDMARAFAELERGQLHHFVLWLANALEGHGDPDTATRGSTLTAWDQGSNFAASDAVLAGLHGGAAGGAGGGAGAGAGAGAADGGARVRSRRVSVNIPTSAPSPRFVLLLACVSRRVQEEGVAHMLTTLLNGLATSTDVATSGAGARKWVVQGEGRGGLHHKCLASNSNHVCNACMRQPMTTAPWWMSQTSLLVYSVLDSGC